MVDFPGYSLSGAFASFFFVLLTMKQSDDFRVVGPAHPILARVGEDALLTCQLLPKRTAVHMEVRLYRLEPSVHMLLAYQDGAEVPEMQTEEYRGRVEWVKDGLAEGNVALKLRNIQPSDNGQYWCCFQERNYWGETSLLLKVADLGSAPHIHMEGSVEGAIRLVCTAKGWFPEPQVYWENTRGEKLLSLSEYHTQDKGGFFYVEATLVVESASTETVSCFIHNPVLTEEKSSAISIPEKRRTELASLKVIGPSQPLLVRVGEDIQLTCHLSPEANAQSMEVRWVRSHRYPAVHVYMDGNHVSGEQMAEYRGRTALVTDGISEGRLTLQIHDARTSDDGQYRCLFEKDGVYQENSMDLTIVGLGSVPHVHMTGPEDGGIRVLCSSSGWFPKPRVQWSDMAGVKLPSFSVSQTQDGDGLFHVEASLVVMDSSLGNVTCSILNPLSGQEKVSTIFLPEPFFPRVSPWQAALAGRLPVLVLLLVEISYIGWREHQAKEREVKERKKESQERDQMENEKERAVNAEEELWEKYEKLQREIGRRKAQFKLVWRNAPLYADWRKEEFEAVSVTLDADTAHPALRLSESRTRVTWQERWQDLPGSTQRFDSLPCVLGQPRIHKGRAFWEVAVGKALSWDLGICRDNVTRTGRVTMSPQHGFWAIRLYEGEYWALTSPETQLSLREQPLKVGIFLDYEAGDVSFYNMTDGSHIFSFPQDTFCGVLRPLFRLWSSDSGSLTICPSEDEERM